MTNEEIDQLGRRPSRMDMNQVKTPQEALEQYFNFFTLEDSRRHMWELYERCVMSYAAEKTVHDEASVVLFFYTHTEMLIEAAWLINNKRRAKEGI